MHTGRVCSKKAVQERSTSRIILQFPCLRAEKNIFVAADSKIGLRSVLENHGVPNCEFLGR